MAKRTKTTNEALQHTTPPDVKLSIVPGIHLQRTLYGHTTSINRIAWAQDGLLLASPSSDGTIRIWNPQTGECLHVLQIGSLITSVAWSIDSKIAACGTSHERIFLWGIKEAGISAFHTSLNVAVYMVAWSPNGNILASASGDRRIHFWDRRRGFSAQRTTNILASSAVSLAWSPTGKSILCGMDNGSVVILNVLSLEVMMHGREHIRAVTCVAWSPDGRYFASASEDRRVLIWKTYNSVQVLHALERHSSSVTCIAFSSDGKWMASKDSREVVLWRCDTWSEVAAFEESLGRERSSLAFHPHLPMLATLGENDTVIHIWELDESVLLSRIQEGVHYTTAKLVLVGDSGVGKTGLGWRLAHGEFKEHASTHGQQFWPIQQLGLKRSDGTECEAVLWDLAGQHVYRQVHSIFLENIAAALLLFDPTNRQDPLKGVQFWLEQLKDKDKLPPALLVAARSDRGAPSVSQEELEQFCQRYGVSGGYISTSAYTGEGIQLLLDKLKTQIPWEEMTATVTTLTFKRIKDYVLKLKEKTDRIGLLVSPELLHEKLLSVDNDWRFTEAEMMTALGHLETHGYIALLKSSAGDQHILLAPDLLVTLASSIILLADKSPRELGALSETILLQGGYPFDELTNLPPQESQVLLDAAVLRFLTHNICFRESLGEETLLVFPALIKQKRPLKDDLHYTEDISYIVRGRVENLYASMVVLLGYTPSFTRINQWQNQAQYEMHEGKICGFRLIEDREGEIELVLYYTDRMSMKGRRQFQTLFEQFLYQRDVKVNRFPPVVCPNGHQQERSTIVKRVQEGKEFVHCEECGDKITLSTFNKNQAVGIDASPWLQREEAMARLRSVYEVHLTAVKGFRRERAVPRCYISRLEKDAAWTNRLVHDLREAGVYVIEKPEQVQSDDYVIVVDTPSYQKAFNTTTLAPDAPLVRSRLQNGQLISLALTGKIKPHTSADCKPGNFCDVTHYSVSLFDLVLNLYAIPLDLTGFEPRRRALHVQWEQTLRPVNENANSPLQIFISYSHKDEEFKDALVIMLAGLQRRGVIDAWQDRRIEPGEEWYSSIQEAIDTCDLALLLVSPDYLASGFIQNEEQPKLFERHKEVQLRVIPIIVRPCLWQNEPVLKDLQALPKDGEAVITFQKENGSRDQVWSDIATAIEKRAKVQL
jgi:small GTP-binding protein